MSDIRCATCNEQAAERADGTPREPLAHKYGPVAHGTFEDPREPYDRAIAYAADLGREHGTNAAGWVFDGNSEPQDYATILQGLADGDPEILDRIPQPDLSGQWADSLTGPQLVNDAMTAAGLPEGPEDLTDICDAYELAFQTAVEDELTRVAHYQLEKV